MNSEKLANKLKKRSPTIQKEICKVLDSICQSLDNIYLINDGGCCWIAYCICKLLYNSGFRVDLALVNRLHEINIGNIKDLNESLTHYFIKLGNYTINQGEDFEDKEYVVLTDVKPNDLLDHYKSQEWCCTYDHRKNYVVYKILKTIYFDKLNDILKK